MTKPLAPTPPAWTRRLYFASVSVLTLTGFAQMPIMRRYHISDPPGLGWLADFYTTHAMHYGAAIMFLGLLAYLCTMYAAYWRRTHALTPLGWVRVLCLLGIVSTGYARSLKNLQGVFLDPLVVMSIDMGHLAFVMLLGISALAAVALRKTAYFK